MFNTERWSTQATYCLLHALTTICCTAQLFVFPFILLCIFVLFHALSNKPEHIASYYVILMLLICHALFVLICQNFPKPAITSFFLKAKEVLRWRKCGSDLYILSSFCLNSRFVFLLELQMQSLFPDRSNTTFLQSSFFWTQLRLSGHNITNLRPLRCVNLVCHYLALNLCIF